MTDEEQIIWKEKASMRDFLVTPILWIFTIITLGLYFFVVYLKRLYTRYTLTNQRLIKETGLLGKRIDEIELFRVKDTKVSQSFFLRLVGIGNIAVVSTDVSGNFTMNYLPDARNKREQLRTMAMKAREARGIRTVVSE